MNCSYESIMIVTFVPEVPNTARQHLQKLLGISDLPDPRWRCHGSSLVTVRLEAVDKVVLEHVGNLPGVRRVFCLSNKERLYKKKVGSVRQPVVIGDHAVVGGDCPTVIAGPCSVESREQVMDIAEMVAEAGAAALRGGCFKPRSSPYEFAGLGELGLEYMAAAREKTGLPVVTEALAVSQVETVASWADVIQIGSRNMSNFPLLFEAGANSLGKPVLLKRGLAASVSEFLEAAEYVLLGRLSTDNLQPGVILCERGIRTFAPAQRFTFDVGVIPVLQQQTHLPVIGDPSHPAGERSLVPALGRAAIAAGADGLLVEVHRDPDHAWCDGDQSLDAASFKTLMKDIKRYSATEVTAG